eukprot:403334221
MIQGKQDMMNQVYGQKRKKQVNEKRVKHDMKDHSFSIKQMIVRKEIKKEITSLIEKDIIMTEQESLVDSDLSYNEFNNFLREDPSRHLFIADAKVKQSQRKLVQEMIENYKEIEPFRHLFLNEQKNEINSKQIDLIFESITFDRYIIGINQKEQNFLSDFMNILALPVFLISSYFKNEKFSGIFNIFEPTNIYKAIFNEKPGYMRPELSVLDLFGLFLSLGGFYLHYLGSDLLFEDVDAQSAIHSIKHAFQFKNPRELQEVELKLQQIYSILGLQGLYRVLFDTALAQNKRQLWHTSDPVLQMREQFDVYFESRRNRWGGSYPRPSVEMIEKQWKLNLHQLQRGVCGVRIELDPDMDYSTYQNALQKWEIIKQ